MTSNKTITPWTGSHWIRLVKTRLDCIGFIVPQGATWFAGCSQHNRHMYNNIYKGYLLKKKNINTTCDIIKTMKENHEKSPDCTAGYIKPMTHFSETLYFNLLADLTHMYHKGGCPLCLALVSLSSYIRPHCSHRSSYLLKHPGGRGSRSVVPIFFLNPKTSPDTFFEMNECSPPGADNG